MSMKDNEATVYIKEFEHSFPMGAATGDPEYFYDHHAYQQFEFICAVNGKPGSDFVAKIKNRFFAKELTKITIEEA